MDKLLSRSEIEEKYKWDLTKYCKDDKEWYEKLEQVKEMCKHYADFKGKLSNKSDLKQFLDLDDKIDTLIDNLIMYAARNLDASLDSPIYNEMYGAMLPVYSKINEESSFFNTEMLSYSEDYLESLRLDDNFKDYDFFMQKLIRKRKHILSEQEELLLQKMSTVLCYDDIQTNFFDVDMKIENAIDKDGKSHEITNITIANCLFSNDRKLREDAYKKQAESVKNINNTMTKNFIGKLRADSFYAKARRFDDSLSRALYEDDMQKNIYENLLKNCHENLEIVEKYFDTKRQLLGYETMEMWDRLCPVVEPVNKKIKFEDGCDIIRDALSILGKDYIDMFDTALKDRWIDVYPAKNKRSGGYQISIYGKSASIMINYTENFNSVNTLAHEFGHAMHSYYSHTTQCKQKASYTIFCAEMASITNEILLVEYQVKNAKTDKEKLYYLDLLLTNFINTFFRQTMFAEFEYFVHDLVDYEKPISKDILNNKFFELNKQYLPGVNCNELCQYLWTGIPHYYSSFYVWKYATGIVCAINFASKILEKNPNALDNYKDFLKKGGSDFSLNILKSSGIDLYDSKVYKVVFDYINKKLLEFIAISKKVKNNDK